MVAKANLTRIRTSLVMVEDVSLRKGSQILRCRVGISFVAAIR